MVEFVVVEFVVVDFGVLVNNGSSLGAELAVSLVGFARPGASFLLTSGAASGPEPIGAVPAGARSESFKRFSSNSVICVVGSVISLESSFSLLLFTRRDELVLDG